MKEKKENHDKLVGEYILDLKKTDLKIYREDSSIYKKLTLTFYSDYSFKLNIQVPFIYMNSGKWSTAGSDLDEWNSLNTNDNRSFAQVGRCCASDSTIMINSVTPQNGAHYIQPIFFKKLHPNTGDLVQ